MKNLILFSIVILFTTTALGAKKVPRKVWHEWADEYVHISNRRRHHRQYCKKIKNVPRRGL